MLAPSWILLRDGGCDGSAAPIFLMFLSQSQIQIFGRSTLQPQAGELLAFRLSQLLALLPGPGRLRLMRPQMLALLCLRLLRNHPSHRRNHLPPQPQAEPPQPQAKSSLSTLTQTLTVSLYHMSLLRPRLRRSPLFCARKLAAPSTSIAHPTSSPRRWVGTAQSPSASATMPPSQAPYPLHRARPRQPATPRNEDIWIFGFFYHYICFVFWGGGGMRHVSGIQVFLTHAID